MSPHQREGDALYFGADLVGVGVGISIGVGVGVALSCLQIFSLIYNWGITKN